MNWSKVFISNLFYLSAILMISVKFLSCLSLCLIDSFLIYSMSLITLGSVFQLSSFDFSITVEVQVTNGEESNVKLLYRLSCLVGLEGLVDTSNFSGWLELPESQCMRFSIYVNLYSVDSCTSITSPIWSILSSNKRKGEIWEVFSSNIWSSERVFIFLFRFLYFLFIHSIYSISLNPLG